MAKKKSKKKESFGKLLARKLLGWDEKYWEKKKRKDRKKKAESKYPKRLKELTKKGKKARKKYWNKVWDEQLYPSELLDVYIPGGDD